MGNEGRWIRIREKAGEVETRECEAGGVGSRRCGKTGEVENKVCNHS